MCLLLATFILSTGNEKTTTQKASIIGRDDDGIGILLVGDRRPPKPDDGSRYMFGSRVFTNGAGEDVSRNTLGVGAGAIGASSQLDWPSCSLASSGHIECTPITAEVTS
jgi:hypothetical protein